MCSFLYDADAVAQVARNEEELRQTQTDAEESMHKLEVEAESLRKALQTLETEKEHYVGKQSASQELVGGSWDQLTDHHTES